MFRRFNHKGRRERKVGWITAETPEKAEGRLKVSSNELGEDYGTGAGHFSR
jgi:hypothetical protein